MTTSFYFESELMVERLGLSFTIHFQEHTAKADDEFQFTGVRFHFLFWQVMVGVAA